ncbi:MAG: peptide chain release factor N(5)-glutamine methyltransferase [Patescibacteria group bacterium]|jgi:release factor glutamine methyltransferase
MAPKKTQTISQLLDWACAELAKHTMDMREARDLLSHSLSVTESYIIGHTQNPIRTQAASRFKDMVKKRVRGIPFAYIVGTKGFYGLDFFVNSSVLIPRPDTEGIIDWTLQTFDRTQQFTIADIGTGSGCIAVTLAKYFPNAKLIAIDTSQKALVVAKKNAQNHKVATRIKFIKGSLLTPISKAVIDLVVSNPPYLEKHELGNVPYEPVQALYGGKNGLEYIDKLINQIIERSIQSAIIEISPTQEHWLKYKLEAERRYSFRLIPDLGNRIRFLVLQKNS